MGVDWGRPMTQRWVYAEVDPDTWEDVRELSTVAGCTITRDLDSELRESASFEIDGEQPGETFIRVYIEADERLPTVRHADSFEKQRTASERMAVGTFLCQTPSLKADGRVRTLTVDAYSPLIELADDRPPYGYTARGKVEEALEQIVGSVSHAPFVGYGSQKSIAGSLVANEDDTWLTFCRTIASYAGCDIACDEQGRVVMEPVRAPSALLPMWTFDDSNSSVLLPDFEETFDWFGLPNRCEVVWSEEARTLVGVAENKDAASPLSTVSRGRKVTVRHDNPEGLEEGCTQAQVTSRAKQLLEEASVVEREYVANHGFCKVRAGDAVRIRYARFGVDVTAQVRSQEISCVTGATVKSVCKVTERMWSA